MSDVKSYGKNKPPKSIANITESKSVIDLSSQESILNDFENCIQKKDVEKKSESISHFSQPDKNNLLIIEEQERIINKYEECIGKLINIIDRQSIMIENYQHLYGVFFENKVESEDDD